MKILFTSRSTLFSQAGGDTQQVSQTADALRRIGHDVDVLLRSESIKLKKYDLVHFFNLGRPADALPLLPKLKIPLIVSTILVDYREFDQQRVGILGKLKNKLSVSGMEYLKSVGRGLKGADAWPGLRYLSAGHNRSIRRVANKASVLISSSASERVRVHKIVGTKARVEVLPLGLPAEFFAPFEPCERKGVICVGRIEGLKNQLNLIRATKGAPWPLKIIGKAAVNQATYYKECQELAALNVKFVGWLNTEHLLEAYRSAKVLVLPSYFETYGLVALEAISQGCNVVIADRPDMNQIFSNMAVLVDPNNPKSIRAGIEKALQMPNKVPSQTEIAEHNWDSIAQNLDAIYQTL